MFKHLIHSGFSFFDNELSGQPIVFVPGLAASAHYGDFLVNAFPQSRILLAELPGHGRAPDPVEEVDVAKLTQELILALQELGIEKPILCGHSLGGQVCLLMEIIKPGFAEKLILIAPAGLETFSSTEIHIILTSLNFSTMIHPITAPRYTSSFLKEGRHFPKSKTMREYVSSMLRRPVNELLPLVKCETQVYFGDNDLLIPNRMFRMESAVSYATRILKNLDNFKVYKLNGTGHWPMLENKNELVLGLRLNNPLVR